MVFLATAPLAPRGLHALPHSTRWDRELQRRQLHGEIEGREADVFAPLLAFGLEEDGAVGALDALATLAAAVSVEVAFTVHFLALGLFALAGGARLGDGFFSGCFGRPEIVLLALIIMGPQLAPRL